MDPRINKYDFDINPRFGAKGEKRWIVRQHYADSTPTEVVKACATKASAKRLAEKLNATLAVPPAKLPCTDAPWADKALEEADGSRTGAILRCALDRNEPDAKPRFEGKATVTSDGFLMCNFVDRNGRGHYGAFVGSVHDLHRNIANLASYLKLNEQDHEALRTVIQNWIGKDWRS